MAEHRTRTLKFSVGELQVNVFTCSAMHVYLMLKAKKGKDCLTRKSLFRSHHPYPFVSLCIASFVNFYYWLYSTYYIYVLSTYYIVSLFYPIHVVVELSLYCLGARAKRQQLGLTTRTTSHPKDFSPSQD